MSSLKKNCECGAEIPLKAYFSNISSPYQCEECSKNIYWKYPLSGSYFQFMFGILLVAGFIMFLKEAWVWFSVTVIGFLIIYFVLWFIDVSRGYVVLTDEEHSERLEKKKRYDGIIFLACLLLFLLYVLF